MGWNQDYPCVPSVESLFEKLTGKTAKQLLHEELERQGTFVKKFEEVLLEDDCLMEVKGMKVTLSDGRVFIPKLTEKFTENGNHGINTYEYVLEDETPVVQYINGDTTDPNVDVFSVPNGYGETDEAEPASDGEIASAESDLQSCICNGIDHCHCDSDRFCTPECTHQIGYNPNVLNEEEPDLRDESY